jgi:hypothetical protein
MLVGADQPLASVTLEGLVNHLVKILLYTRSVPRWVRQRFLTASMNIVKKAAPVFSRPATRAISI